MRISRERLKAAWAAFARGYKAVALVLFNALVLFVMLNLACLPILKGQRPESREGGYREISESVTASLFPDLTERQRAQFQREIATAHMRFEPFTHFDHADTTGDYVNVRHGVRGLGDRAWPPRPGEATVFVFGGSTTFGWVPDVHTIPARLQDSLRSAGSNATVYNFGRAYYYSTQERILFEKLLQAGRVPRLAVFIDGLNDFYHTGIEVPRLERFQYALGVRPRWWMGLPVARLLETRAPKGDAGEEFLNPDPELLQAVIDRYLANKRLIEAVAREYGVTPVFVWQPVPTYGLESPHYPFGVGDLGRHEFSRRGYPLMADRVKQGGLGENFLWLAELQAGVKEAIYVDQVHYSPDFSNVIARAISKFMLDRRLLSTGDRK